MTFGLGQDDESVLLWSVFSILWGDSMLQTVEILSSWCANSVYHSCPAPLICGNTPLSVPL